MTYFAYIYQTSLISMPIYFICLTHNTVSWFLIIFLLLLRKNRNSLGICHSAGLTVQVPITKLTEKHKQNKNNTNSQKGNTKQTT
jgi:hypothetical protein